MKLYERVSRYNPKKHRKPFCIKESESLDELKAYGKEQAELKASPDAFWVYARDSKHDIADAVLIMEVYAYSEILYITN